MAATDQTYHNQKALDVVFGVAGIALLVSTIGMFVQDYNRPWKAEQREFRDVEAALFARQAVNDMPDPEKFQAARAALEKATKQRDAVIDPKKGQDLPLEQRIKLSAGQGVKVEERIEQLKDEIAALQPDKERKQTAVGEVKSQLESRTSFYNIAVESGATREAEAYRKEVEALEQELTKAQAELDDVLAQMKAHQREKDLLERPLNSARTEVKRLSDDLIRKARAAVTRGWGFGDWFRTLPIIDAFASPTKIHQFTLNDLTIDYNFKGVTRFDRCMTCHQGIDRPGFSKANLQALVQDVPKPLEQKLEKTRKLLGDLRENLAPTFKSSSELDRSIPAPDSLQLQQLSKDRLTEARINEFCAHPRLDLFVGSNSKHPAEKFGCTSCHAGQGSATDFYWSSHTPNDPEQKKRWEKEHGWGSVHYWDFPMLPRRFLEASCLKCHHQVTDLIADGNRHEAPKLLRGYNLIRENGCFGCHEIHGSKDGKPIGPDMRLEPYPPLEQLPAEVQAKALADRENPPGTLRKVGPSLFRLAEKTNEDWVARWVKSPRSFRPDTKMPHFYGLSNNSPAALKGTGQEKFPDAEAASIAHYLMVESNKYLKKLGDLRKDGAAGQKKDEQLVEELGTQLANRALLADMTNKEKDDLKNQLEEAKTRIAMRRLPPPIAADDRMARLKGSAFHGRKLFTERGCLACHNHSGTHEPLEAKGKEEKARAESLPAVFGEAHFGPTLDQIRAKLGTARARGDTSEPTDTASARRWLIHWVTNPTLHSPRTRMPITHLTDQEAADVAEWLLSQDPAALDPQAWEEWKKTQVPAPDEKTLEKLAEVYLVRIVSQRELKKFFKEGLDETRAAELPADEKELAARLKKAGAGAARRGEMMWYLGRKAVSRLGCYGCHDVLGHENAKPIGTGLNEWGKKDPERLAFEDIVNYLDTHYVEVKDWADQDALAQAFKANKLPYEKFFAEALRHHTREGYLHQKIKAPRSYDYQRLRAWDDRSRMPQFKFAHPRRRPAETPDQFAARKEWAREVGAKFAEKKPRQKETAAAFFARAHKEEAGAREAVMTFVLGLVGEAIPHQYLNNPPPDRMAEVKGRQVLDRFNCAGCHMVRPGSFDFRASPAAVKLLSQGAVTGPNDYNFTEHNIWAGQPPAGSDILTAHGMWPRPAAKNLLVKLTEAVAFRDKKGELRSVRGADLLRIPLTDLVRPAPAAVSSLEAFETFLREEGPYGGTFADLLVKYLIDLSPRTYPDETGNKDNARARASVPPPLIAQGERTQPEWLFRFLRDPERVRRLTILRMPKFNLSEDEARALVNYFSAVDRLNNPGIGLNQSFAAVPQRGDFDDQFWRERTAEYVRRLETTDDPHQPKQKLYESLVAELTPAWKRVVAERADTAKDAETKLKELTARVAELEKKAAKGQTQAVKDAQKARDFWAAESTRRRTLADRTTVDGLRAEWRTTQAYAHGGFRVLTKVCASCHELGHLQPSPDQLQGPSLNLTPERLRPGWLKRWIAHPQRYLPYPSSMPQNFPRDQKQFQELIAGAPLEQVTGVRDTLMNLPRVLELSVNRAWLQTIGATSQAAESGGGEKGKKDEKK